MTVQLDVYNVSSPAKLATTGYVPAGSFGVTGQEANPDASVVAGQVGRLFQVIEKVLVVTLLKRATQLRRRSRADGDRQEI